MENKHKLFKVSQSAIIRNTDGAILLLRQGEHWLLPGGRIEETDSDWKSALAREVMEETGLKVVNVINILQTEWSPSGATYIVVFECTVESTGHVVLSSEHQEYRWVPPKELHMYGFAHQKVADHLTNVLQ